MIRPAVHDPTRLAVQALPAPGPGARPHGPVPYITQIDGSPQQWHNCGPATMAMAGRSYGVKPGLSDAQLVEAARLARGSAVYAQGGSPPRAMVAIGNWMGVRTLTNPDTTYERISRQLQSGFLVPLAGDFYALPQHANPAKAIGHWTLLTGSAPDGSFVMNDPADTRPGSRHLTWAQLQAFLQGNDGLGTFAASMRVG